MITVVQRVIEASVSIEGKVYSKIERGLLILAGVCKGDTDEQSKYLAAKITGLRIFNDDDGRMNKSVRDIDGEILVVSQFTLCSDKGKSGNRPSFINAEDPVKAIPLYEMLVSEMRSGYSVEKIKTGVFAAKMEVALINDGPVTIILEK